MILDFLKFPFTKKKSITFFKLKKKWISKKVLVTKLGPRNKNQKKTTKMKILKKKKKSCPRFLEYL